MVITGITDDAVPSIVVGDTGMERLDVSVRVGQPTDCTSLQTGELFLIACSALSSAFILLVGSKIKH